VAGAQKAVIGLGLQEGDMVTFESPVGMSVNCRVTHTMIVVQGGYVQKEMASIEVIRGEYPTYKVEEVDKIAPSDPPKLDSL
jgi:uncharacterized membrane protein YjjP (DUF1212 family)